MSHAHALADPSPRAHARSLRLASRKFFGVRPLSSALLDGEAANDAGEFRAPEGGLASDLGVETKNETFVWCGPRICQKRASNGTTVVRNYFREGFEEGSSDYVYTRDHLDSVREVVASDGTTIASRLWYTSWGKATEAGSGALSDFGFTGHFFDRPTGLWLTRYRAYDPHLGRWLSRDPIELKGGFNLYGYVENDPIRYLDPLGLEPALCKVGDPHALACEAKRLCKSMCQDPTPERIDICVIKTGFDELSCETIIDIRANGCRKACDVRYAYSCPGR